MKTALTLAVLLAFGTGAALAEQTKPAPVKMTAAEMEKVVAGAYGPQYRQRVDYPCTTCTPIGDGIPDRLRLHDGSCKEGSDNSKPERGPARQGRARSAQ